MRSRSEIVNKLFGFECELWLRLRLRFRRRHAAPQFSYLTYHHYLSRHHPIRCRPLLTRFRHVSHILKIDNLLLFFLKRFIFYHLNLNLFAPRGPLLPSFTCHAWSHTIFSLPLPHLTPIQSIKSLKFITILQFPLLWIYIYTYIFSFSVHGVFYFFWSNF